MVRPHKRALTSSFPETNADLVPAIADYGESSYIGPIDGAQPNSQSWVDGFDHSALQEINRYYATAFRTGNYPAITQDKVYLTARPHPAFANAYSDPVGPPTGREHTQDNFYALVFATAPSTVVLSSGAGSQTFSVNAGATRLQYALAAGGGMSAKITRNGADVVNFSPSFTFNGNPAICASKQPNLLRTKHRADRHLTLPRQFQPLHHGLGLKLVGSVAGLITHASLRSASLVTSLSSLAL